MRTLGISYSSAIPDIALGVPARAQRQEPARWIPGDGESMATGLTSVQHPDYTKPSALTRRVGHVFGLN